MATPSRLVPEIDLEQIEPWTSEHGQHKVLVSGLRVIQRDDGTAERANQRFPAGEVHALSLPHRLGGGYVFYQADRQGTRLWRAAHWVADVEPLASLKMTVADVTPGFDRLYLRAESTGRLRAIDPSSGRNSPLGRLPASSAHGHMSFADGWRAVVTTDLRGPLATFDAGHSWWPMPVAEPVVGAAVVDGDPAVFVSRGTYRVDAWGALQFVADEQSATSRFAQPPDEPAPETSSNAGSRSSLLGSRPLRVAVHSGWPDGSTTAVVAHGGALTRVSLPDGAVVATVRGAFAERDADCQAVRMGRSFGFVCGQQHGATVIYAFAPPLAVREVARFAKPRFVSSSGTGALVVRGRCDDATERAADTRTYCIIAPDESRKEIGVRGDLGAERVVALADGRVVVLVPPRLGAPGRLTTISGDGLTTVPLEFPDRPKRAVAVARRGLWLEGFQQRSRDSVAGWVEAGGPIVGVWVNLKGRVTVGKVQDDGELLASGPLAVVVRDTGIAHESLDGGRSWKRFELPELPPSPRDAKSRGCSAVGCALRGWLRVGWGPAAVKGDLGLAPVPDPIATPAADVRSLRLSCTFATPPTLPPAAGPAGAAAGLGRSGGASIIGDWSAFRRTPAPALGKDDIGVGKASSSYDRVPSHVYVWGPKGADWTRVGWWLIRFFDRFDPGGGVRVSAITRPPWSDEVVAAEAIGARHHGGYWRWAAQLEPSGSAALLSACQGSDCRFYAVAADRPIVPLQLAGQSASMFRQVVPHGVVRIGETWFFATDTGLDALDLWRAELGVVRHVRRYPRLDRRRYGVVEPPRLVRRVLGGELGFLLTVPADPATGSDVGHWIVLPINTATGALGEPVSLGPDDLSGELPPPCPAHQDGWLLDGRLTISPQVEAAQAQGYVDDIEMRMRLDPGGSCVESIAARASRSFAPAGQRRAGGRPARSAPAPASEQVPLAANQRDGDAGWLLWCRGGRSPRAGIVEHLLDIQP